MPRDRTSTRLLTEDQRLSSTQYVFQTPLSSLLATSYTVLDVYIVYKNRFLIYILSLCVLKPSFLCVLRFLLSFFSKNAGRTAGGNSRIGQEIHLGNGSRFVGGGDLKGGIPLLRGRGERTGLQVEEFP